MDCRIPEGRFTARPYVVASFGSSSDCSWMDRDNRIWTAEAFGLKDSWAFSPSADYLRHLDAGYCSAFFNADVLHERLLMPAYDEAGMIAAEGLASWCTSKLITYPASNLAGVLVSGLSYSWSVHRIECGDVRGVIGYAVPSLVCRVANYAEMRQYVGMWARATFGPAFLPNDLGWWGDVACGEADRKGFTVGRAPWDSEWRNSPRTWNAWR